MKEIVKENSSKEYILESEEKIVKYLQDIKPTDEFKEMIFLTD